MIKTGIFCNYSQICHFFPKFLIIVILIIPHQTSGSVQYWREDFKADTLIGWQILEAYGETSMMLDPISSYHGDNSLLFKVSFFDPST